MRENINISLTAYEWKQIEKKMRELSMNRYQYGRYCVMKEAGILIDGKTTNEENTIRGNNEPTNDLKLEN